MPEAWDYKKAGLDLEAYAETMAGIQPLLVRTHRPGVVPPPFPPRKGGKGVGGFASLFDLHAFTAGKKYDNPVLVTCTDGVGSKLKVASMVGRFDTVGIDLVAMSVNDLICTGGEPLVFLDYLAMPKDDPELTLQLVRGIGEGCLQAGCSLVGGETAILPDFYAPGDFDLAGFAAGIVERDEIVDGRAISAGDVLVALPSSGLHSNGYSLARKIVFDAAKLDAADRIAELGGTVGDTLLSPTAIYVRTIRSLLATFAGTGAITGLANITGGGVPDNLSRILPPECRAVVTRSSWSLPPAFAWLKSLGNVAEAEMDRVFNCGVGFVVVAKAEFADRVLERLKELGESAWFLGEIRTGPAGVEYA